jgi:hypothetical protein
MDRFEESIKGAQENYEVQGDFVEDTMGRIVKRQPKRRFSIRIWAPALAAAVVVVVILIIALPGGGSKQAANSAALKTASKINTQQPAKQSTASTVASATPSGTDNASLENDINSVQSSMNQENTDQNSANSTINDSQQEIAVPTD